MTALEQLLKEELEKEKQHSQRLETRLSMNQETYNKSLVELKAEYINSLQSIKQSHINALNEIANQYTNKLKELCNSEESDEQLENDLEIRLTALEKGLNNLQMESEQGFTDIQTSFDTLTNNQKILYEQLKSIKQS